MKGRELVTSDGMQASPHVITSVNPEVVEHGCVAWFACRAAPDLYVEGDLGTGLGGLTITRLVVELWEPSAGARLSSSSLRHVKIPEILSQAASQIGGMGAWRWGADGTPEPISNALKAVEKFAKPELKRGRTGHSDDHYRRVAHIYLNMQAVCGTRGIRGALSEALSQDQGRIIPENTVRDWLHEAGERGFLTSRGRGVAGRDPGPKLFDKEAEK